MTNNREEIFQAISKERENQIAQWGGAKHDRQQDNHDWAVYINRQMQKLFHASRTDTSEHKDRLIKIAALAVAALEVLDDK